MKIKNKKKLFFWVIFVNFFLLNSLNVSSAASPLLDTNLEFYASQGDFLIYSCKSSMETTYSTEENYFMKVIINSMKNSSEYVDFTITEYKNITEIKCCNYSSQVNENWTLCKTYSKRVNKIGSTMFDFLYIIPKDVNLGVNDKGIFRNKSFIETEYYQEKSKYYDDATLTYSNSFSISGTNSSAEISWNVNFTKSGYYSKDYNMEVDIIYEVNHANCLSYYSSTCSQETIINFRTYKQVIYYNEMSLVATSISEPLPLKKKISGFSNFQILITALLSVISLIYLTEKIKKD